MIPARQHILAQRRPLRVLVMDDDPSRVVDFAHHLGARKGVVEMVHAPSAKCAQSWLKRRNFDVVFLDHDLELSTKYYGIDDHGSGTELVGWMTRMGPHRWNRSLVIVHSLNTLRGAGMAEDLKEHGFNVTRRAYAWEDGADLRKLAGSWEWPIHLERWDCLYPPSKPERHKNGHGRRAWQLSREG